MPRCLMAKKWKAYPWADREGGHQILESEPSGRNEEDEEEIDVVGDANDCNNPSSCWAPIPAPNNWGPSSPTAGATAPSPPPTQSGVDMASRIAVLYNGKSVLFWRNGTGGKTGTRELREMKKKKKEEEEEGVILQKFSFGPHPILAITGNTGRRMQSLAGTKAFFE